jgi:hypothetical protein
MLTASQCKALASEYKSLAQQPNVSEERAATLVNIARSLVGLATQLDRLAADMREKCKVRPPQLAASFCSNVACCAGFRMPACGDHPHARRAGVRKAPRQEIAGYGALTVQRALWGFGAGVSVGKVASMVAIGLL